jgi:lysophospholipase L1-like esterase
MASIADKIAQIRQAIFGKDVRENLAQGIEAINNEVESTTEKQSNLDATFKQLIIDAGSNNSEIVAARHDNINNEDHDSLPDRLDNFSASLNEKANEIELVATNQRVDTIINLQQGSTTGDIELIDARMNKYGGSFGSLKSRIDSYDSSYEFNLGKTVFIKGSIDSNGNQISSTVNIITKDFLSVSELGTFLAFQPINNFKYYIALYDSAYKKVLLTGWKDTASAINLNGVSYIKILVANQNLDSSITIFDKSKLKIYYSGTIKFTKSIDDIENSKLQSEGMAFNTLKDKLDFVNPFKKIELSFDLGSLDSSGNDIAGSGGSLRSNFISTDSLNKKIFIQKNPCYRHYIAFYSADTSYIGNTGWVDDDKIYDLSSYAYIKMLLSKDDNSNISLSEISNLNLYKLRYTYTDNKYFNEINFSNTNWYNSQYRYLGFLFDNSSTQLSGEITINYKIKTYDIEYPLGYSSSISVSNSNVLSFDNQLEQSVNTYNVHLKKYNLYDISTKFNIGSLGNYLKFFFGINTGDINIRGHFSLIDAYITDSMGVKYNILNYCKILLNKNLNAVKYSDVLLEYNSNESDKFDEEYSNKNPLGNYKAGFLGDSITFGYDPDNSPNQMSRPWVKQVEEYLGMECINYGINSSSVCPFPNVDDSIRNPMTKRYINMADDLDVIGVMGGINDSIYPNSIPLGNMSDRTTDTLYGGYHVLFKGLARKYRGKFVFVMVYPHYDAFETWSGVTYPFSVIQDMIREVANYYSIPVLDLSKESQLSPYLDDEYELFRRFQTTEFHDAHPTQAGADIIAKTVANFINSKYSVN